MRNMTGGAYNGTSEGDVFPHALEIVYFCVGLPLGVIICLGNFILLSVVLPKKGPLRDSTRMLLAGLSVCDVVAGALFIVHVVLLPFQEDLRGASREGCLFWALLLTVPVMASFLHLTVICGERNHFVCQPAAVVSRKKAILICACLWSYCLVLGLVGMFFSLCWKDENENENEEEDAGRWKLCDVVTLPGYYLLILALHVLATLLINVYFAVSIRGMLRLHQRKIQVTNTITYNNLVEDIRVAWLFFLAYSLQLFPWLPFTVMLAILAAGVNTPSAFIIARVCYLCAQIPGLKFMMYFWRNKEIMCAVRKRLGCSKTPPRLSPAHTH